MIITTGGGSGGSALAHEPAFVEQALAIRRHLLDSR